jgi:hypothetical protein
MEIVQKDRDIPMDSQQCYTCGEIARPGEPAFFVLVHYQDSQQPVSEEWICDQCVAGGTDYLRTVLRERAEQYRRMAEGCAAEAEEASIPEDVQREAAAVMEHRRRPRSALEWRRRLAEDHLELTFMLARVAPPPDEGEMPEF